jgi:uncharacterized protein (DUF362 family)
MGQRISRKTFLKATAATAVLPAIAGAAKTASKPGYSRLNKWPGRVAVNYNKNASSGSNADEKVVKKMVDDSILQLTGKSDAGKAWRSLFPKINAETKIAVKINILNPMVPPHPFVVMAVIEGLRKMKVKGKPFPAVNILIYDGFNGRSFEEAGFTKERFPGITMNQHRKDVEDFGDGAHNNQPYARTLKECDYLINVPGIRGHSWYAGNFTMGFKSHYGTYPPKYHDENAPGYLRDINCTGPVFKKTVFTVFGGIFGLKEGNGPRGDADSFLTYAKKIDPSTENPAPNTVIMSTDPVSAEFQAIKVARMCDNKRYTLKSMPSYLKASAGVRGDLKPVYNIGVLDEKKMDVRKIVNGKKA